MELILVIDDDESLRDVIGLILEKENFRPIVAADGITGLQLALTSNPALILLDLHMPRLDGLEVCKRVRAAGINTPIIILSAVDDELDKALLLEMGADDYIVKPFGRHELLARIRAILRRSRPEVRGPVLSFSGIEVDLERRVVRNRGNEVHLARAEFNILAFFLQNPGRPLSVEVLLSSACGSAAPTYIRRLHSYVTRLRRKLEDDPEAPRHFLTIRGFGYEFIP
jgi:DNA-binding response OmpR family regulator